MLIARELIGLGSNRPQANRLAGLYAFTPIIEFRFSIYINKFKEEVVTLNLELKLNFNVGFS